MSLPGKSYARITGLTALGAIFGCAAPSKPPAPAATRDGRWVQDIEYYAQNIPRLHVDAFHHTSQARFERAVSELKSSVSDREDHELTVGLVMLASSIRDAHTTVWFDGLPDFHIYPFMPARFSDGWYVTEAAVGSEDLLGARLVAVEGTSLEDMRPLIARVSAGENEALINFHFARYIRIPEVLHTLGVIGAVGPATFTFEWPDLREGELPRREDRVLGPLRNNQPHKWVAYHAYHGVATPLCLQHRGKSYWYEYLEESRTLYCAYNTCASDKAQPFAKFAGEVLRFIDNNDVERFVLDLRANGGGDSSVAWPLFWGLQWRPKVNRPGRLFALIGNRTMSSAALNVQDLRRSTKVIVLGQPTGQKPNCFGELRKFTLPNSKLTATYSTAVFRSYPGEGPESYVPDVLIEPGFADFARGCDPVLDAALTYQPAASR